MKREERYVLRAVAALSRRILRHYDEYGGMTFPPEIESLRFALKQLDGEA